MQKSCQRKAQLKAQPAGQYSNYHKSNIYRIFSDKEYSSSAIAIEILYSTCIWNTGVVKMFELISNIIWRARPSNWQKSKIDSMCT